MVMMFLYSNVGNIEHNSFVASPRQGEDQEDEPEINEEEEEAMEEVQLFCFSLNCAF